ncbi:MAG: tRNA (adenosine(37)-N6)-threonylcarbamoyltransferase complex dimerization subunit type 1 TsaB [Candidatus Melainabacteria bacterium]|nr:MAG: tRNA (adenosine(37)-N6)-threonylcarbamoyltransferase complex dimerization subunit type 1 TsaB [Candidatus Melainabacteria bacterium]
MRFLSFDTSTSDLHVCLASKGSIVAASVVQSKPEDRQYAAALLIPTIEDVLNQANWRKSDLEALVVGVGPGSFTGVRTAVVTARTIAQALNLPLLGVPILECYAYQHGASTAVVLGAGRQEFFAASYRVTPPKSRPGRPLLVPTGEPACLSREAVLAILNDARSGLVETSCLAAFKESQADLKALPHLNNIAYVQSELALNKVSLSMAQSGASASQELLAKTFSYERIQPLYLRNASITLKKAR